MSDLLHGAAAALSLAWAIPAYGRWWKQIDLNPGWASDALWLAVLWTFLAIDNFASLIR